MRIGGLDGGGFRGQGLEVVAFEAGGRGGRAVVFSVTLRAADAAQGMEMPERHSAAQSEGLTGRAGMTGQAIRVTHELGGGMAFG